MAAPQARWLALLVLATSLTAPASASVFDKAVDAVAGAVHNATHGVAQFFEYGGNSNYTPAAIGPLTAKSARAMAFSLSGSGPAVGGGPTTDAPLPNGASVAVHLSGPNQVILSFQGGSLRVGGSAGQPPPAVANVTFLQDFVYTSTAPAVLLQTFAPLHQGANPDGALAQVNILTLQPPRCTSIPSNVLWQHTASCRVQTIARAMGGAPVLHVICTGEGGGGGGLAALCGPWAALSFPTANVDVISFAGPDWASSFNTQFTWSFFRLVTLFYLWPFSSANVANAQALKADPSSLTAAGEHEQRDCFPSAPPTLAMGWARAGWDTHGRAGLLLGAVDRLITPQAVQQAINLPNLPTNLPPGVPPDQYQGPDLGPLGSAPQEPPPGPCPLILCKTREVVRAACLAFSDNSTRSSTALPPGLPSLRVPSPGSDCVVAWDAPTQTAFFYWQGTESRLDWAQDFLAFTSDDFRPAAQLAAVLPGVEVHRGFLNEFNRLAAPANPPPGQLNLTSALDQISGGAAPRIVVASG